jgi:hypothetical protein
MLKDWLLIGILAIKEKQTVLVITLQPINPFKYTHLKCINNMLKLNKVSLIIALSNPW